MIETFNRLPFPTSTELQSLFANGVRPEAMSEPWPLRAAKVRFDGGFYFVSDGERAIIMPAEDHGEVIDLIAWRAGKMASWRNVAFCLGDADQIFCPSTYFADGALHIHASPLDWLRAGRAGITIIRPDLVYAYLRHVSRLAFTDVGHARQVKRWLRPSSPQVEFLIDVAEDRSAA